MTWPRFADVDAEALAELDRRASLRYRPPQPRRHITIEDLVGDGFDYETWLGADLEQLIDVDEDLAGASGPGDLEGAA